MEVRSVFHARCSSASDGNDDTTAVSDGRNEGTTVTSVCPCC
jgi:hypothetical protein